MEHVADILFDYLRNVILDPVNAFLNVGDLPESFRDFCNGLLYFVDCIIETRQLAQSLSKGDFSGELPPPDNEIASPLKSLHASLRHLTWQTQQIANGDYQQRVDFLGDFSKSFNTMVEKLAERQQTLEKELDQIQNKAASLEQSNLLLTTLMHNVSQQIFVIDRVSGEVLFTNSAALNAYENDANYVEYLLRVTSEHSENGPKYGFSIDVQYSQEENDHYLTIKLYRLEWYGSNAEAMVISDVSATRNMIKELESHAYYDSSTHLFNRAYGMLALDKWLLEKKRFVLIFVDLDNLKHINDEFGHKEGDIYISNAAKHMKTFSQNAVVCRIGGDEFMLLVPNISYDEADATMRIVNHNFRNDEFLNDKTYSYNTSYGICAVEASNELSASDILSIADDRMYENKRMRKKSRQKAPK
ncbi:MAG: diguanylate cyclase [Oscillospiraceae bacterium]|jgi:diguanylate cyclase (GGDEF)-like protein|nr:diguanylate cyclase [Oscillospiraceae bacterium]